MLSIPKKTKQQSYLSDAKAHPFSTTPEHSAACFSQPVEKQHCLWLKHAVQGVATDGAMKHPFLKVCMWDEIEKEM